MSDFYITTPIYYVNSHPHLGHAYTTIVADVLKRFYRLKGANAYMLTGTDEHGDKIVKAAMAVNQNPKEFVDNISSEFKGLWKELEIDYDHFVRTTDDEHKKAVQYLLQRIHDNGDIYFAEYGGLYCFGCERFYTEKELEDELCPQHKTKPEYISEKNYFFKMSKYQDWLRQYILENPDFIRPERYRNEVLAMLDGNVLEDLCISRPKTRLEWGIELPFNTDYVCYVWFDALANYISALGWPDNENDKNGDFQRYWPAQHLIAKDILKPHGIFWPTMLKSANLPIYTHLNVHGYWLMKETKMSKSLGNVVDPLFTAKHFGLDAFRYFLLREMHFGSDASYSEDALVQRINSDLANDLGNLFSRVLSMNAKYFESKVPPLGVLTDEDKELFQNTKDSCENFLNLFQQIRFSQALEALWEPVRAMNKYVDFQAPWVLFKEEKSERLATVVRTLLENMYSIAYMLWPIMPKITASMQEQLGRPFNDALLTAENLEKMLSTDAKLETGAVIASSSNLFPRIEVQGKEDAKKMPKDKSSSAGKNNPNAKSILSNKNSPSDKNIPIVQEKTSQDSENIEFTDFQKIDMRVGTILAAEQHPDADKLLRFDVDLGEAEPRQIISGIAEFFKPENLVGQKVVVVANLPPRKLRGLISHGMILTAEKDNTLSLLAAPDAPNGAKIS